MNNPSRPSWLSTLILVLAGLVNANADTIFEQDFENGLGPRERVLGSWSINDTHPVLNNGTMMMGHSEAYGVAGQPVQATPAENFYAYYEVTLDLRGFEDVVLTFDFIGNIEQDFDGFNVIGVAWNGFIAPTLAPPTGLLNPTAASGLQYRGLTFHADSSLELGPTAWSSPVEGTTYNLTAIFDLGAFDDGKVTLRFQFGTDALWGGQGANFDNILVEGTRLPESDTDGMPDSFEDANGLQSNVNDGGDDLDMDGLTNFQEFQLCTNPDNPDTDGDGFTDDIEDNSGVYNGPDDPGTDPTRADTDGDGIDDMDETETDPNNPDTDGDGFSDGTDPDPNDPSVFPTVLFGGDPFTTTHVWNAGTMNLARAEAVTAEGNQEGTRIVAMTPHIHFHDDVSPPVFGSESRPYPLWDDDNGGAGGFGNREDFAIKSTGQINVRQPGGIVTFVCNSDDGFVLRIDGNQVGTVGDRGRDDTFMEVDLTPGVHDLEFVHWERGGGAGVTLAVLRRFGGGPPEFNVRNRESWELVSAFDPSGPFTITEFSRDDAAEIFSITFNSTGNGSYAIDLNLDLAGGGWFEATDLAGTGATTETELDFATVRQNLGLAEEDPLPDELFLRIRDVELQDDPNP